MFTRIIYKFGWLLLLARYFWSAASGDIYFEGEVPHVKLNGGGVLSGKVSVSREGRPFNSFTGVTYATIPDRFAESKLESGSWEGVESAVPPGPICPQSLQFSNQRQDEISVYGEEDCLSLNVYVPHARSNRVAEVYPVMVWIHGGGYITGGGSYEGPRYFMDEDVILITINYRLGVLGFLSTEDTVIPGNNGLKDIVVALQWIQQNIKHFGGNVNKVTLFGEGAGGNAVHYLLLFTKVEGFFNRAIIQSGSALQSQFFHPNPKETAVQLATYMNCSTIASEPSYISSQEILACLRSAKKEEIVKAQISFKNTWPLNTLSFDFGPALEEKPSRSSSLPAPFLMETPFSRITDRCRPAPSIPVMMGVNENEGHKFCEFVLGNSELTTELNLMWNDIAPKTFDFLKLVEEGEETFVAENVRQFYFGRKAISKETAQNLTNLYFDALVNYPLYRSVKEAAGKGKGGQVYLYQYDYRVPSPASGLKVLNANEVSFLFDMDGEPNLAVQSEHEKFSKNFVRLWTSFATNGEPTHSWGNSVDREWKPVTVDEAEGKRSLRWYRINSNPGYIEDPYSERMAFWEKLYGNDFHLSASLRTTTEEPGRKKKTEL